jgi:indole-3-glycerol phosphate synthase/phosphoribosylanthranilate isomerase
MNRIQELLDRRRADVDRRKAKRTPQVPNDDRRLNWNRNRFRIFAEIKRSSLSAGSIREIPDLASLALSYEAAGTDAISVLTEEHFFHGSIEDLRSVRKAVRVPVLQKDFIIDPYQILEAKEAGADFILLIARFLTIDQIQEFLELCETIRLNALVEVTDETDLAKIQMPVRFLGVNSRDLETLEVRTERFERLRQKLPEVFLIAESGINSQETLQHVIDLGYNGALIGEHFLRAKDPGAELERFVARTSGGAVRAAPKIKICGITNERDAMMAIDAGASALGFIFAESPRRIAPQQLHEFRQRIPIPCVGVFRGNPTAEIAAIVKDGAIDIAQIYDENCTANVPVWRARTCTTLQQIEQCIVENHQLLDIKLPDKEIEEAWTLLQDRNVFALAGGLHPGNVQRAISLCRPQWIDVARGVEREPGVKDPQKVQQFIQAVNQS